MTIRRFADRDDLIAGAADDVAALVHEAVAARGVFRVALAGGTTPLPLYQRLTTTALPWDLVELWFADERAVPPEDPASNYQMARVALLDLVGASARARVRRVQGELAPASAAEVYEHELVRTLGVPPRLDLVLLGLGTDGHTASLFPRSPALTETARWVVATPGPLPGDLRITLTPRTIGAARHVRFLVSGASKADVLAEVLEGPHDPDRLPAQLIATADTDVSWFVDEAAAARLRRTSASHLP